jgi:hypothetical protein
MPEESFHGMSPKDPRLADRLDELADMYERIRDMTVEGLVYENTPSGITLGLPTPTPPVPPVAGLIPVQVAVASTSTVNWPYTSGTDSCSPTLCALASVPAKVDCVVPIPSTYAVWEQCEDPLTNANRIATAAAPLFRETGNPYTDSIGQWNAVSETVVAWNTKAQNCGTVEAPADIGHGIGYYDCDDNFVLVAVAEEQVLETLWGLGSFLDRVSAVRICMDGGVKRLVQETRRTYYVNGHAVLDKQLCSTIIDAYGPC